MHHNPQQPFKADLPVPSSIDHFVARDIFQDLIFHFDHNHTEFTRLFFDTAILPPSSPYNPIQLLIELLFANMLRLPQPEQKFVYYGVLIVDMCTARPKEVAPVLGKVIYTVFERVQDLDVECQFRFTTWFAHHLSNFDYKWKWAAW